jgi:hypothetical protein
MPHRLIDQPIPGFTVDPAQLGVNILVSVTPETQRQEVRVEILDLHLKSPWPL